AVVVRIYRPEFVSFLIKIEFAGGAAGILRKIGRCGYTHIEATAKCGAAVIYLYYHQIISRFGEGVSLAVAGAVICLRRAITKIKSIQQGVTGIGIGCCCGEVGWCTHGKIFCWPEFETVNYRRLVLHKTTGAAA